MKRNLISLAMLIALSACGSNSNENNAATFSGITEANIDNSSGNFTNGATSNIVVNDDASEQTFITQVDTRTSYGIFSITADGTWAYRLDADNNSVVTLVDGSILTDIIDITSFDGTQTTITITITGTYVPSPAIFSGDITALIKNDQVENTTGSLTISDENEGEAEVIAENNSPTTYGAFSITSAGEWTYTLDTGNAEIASLPNDSTVTDTIDVTSLDGTSTSIIITIAGPTLTNTAATFTGDLSQSIGSNLQDDAIGIITVVDLDPAEANIIVQNDFTSTYGIFSINANGEWAYALDQTNPSVSDLSDGSSTLTDAITISSTDGTTIDVVITITAPVADDKVVSITNLDDSDSGDIRLGIDDSQVVLEEGREELGQILKGRITASIKKSETIDVETGEDSGAYILLNGSSNGGTNRGLLILEIKGDTYTMIDENEAHIAPTITIPFVEDEWTDIDITWDATGANDVDTAPLMTLSINGVSVTDAPFPAPSVATSQLDRVVDGLRTFRFRTGLINSETWNTGELLVDDIVLYSTEQVDGVETDVVHWKDDFENYTAGEALPEEGDDPAGDYDGSSEFTEVKLVIGNGKSVP